MAISGRRAFGVALGGIVLAGVVAAALVACGQAAGPNQPSASASLGPAPTPTSTSGQSAPPSEGASLVPFSSSPASSVSPAPSVSSPPGPFTLTSPAFADNAAIPKANTCDGADRSPELRWSNAPGGTAAFVLEVLDPDARDWVHWLVLDVPGSASGSLPADVGTGSGAPQQGRNSFGKVGWGGPCPPSGTHHYVFTLFALDAPLGLAGNPDRAAIDKAIATHHVLGKATLTGTYRRG